MFFFVKRVPWVCMTLALVSLVSFGLTWVAPGTPLGATDARLVRLYEAWINHPYLKPPASLKSRLPAEVLAPPVHGALPSYDERMQEQAVLESLSEAFEAEIDRSRSYRAAFVPQRGVVQWGWLSHPFVHFGWLHLLGSVIALCLVGPLVEALGGRLLFGLLYLGGGLLAAGVQFLLDPSSPLPMGGALGSLAACMGALAAGLSGQPSEVSYWAYVGRVVRGKTTIPVWGWGLLWLAAELWDALTPTGSDFIAAPVTAHIMTFGFGAATAWMLRQGWVRATAPKPAHPSLELGFVASERKDSVLARRAFEEVLADEPENDDALFGLARLDLEPRGDRERGLERLTKVLVRVVAAKRTDDVVWMMRLVAPSLEPDELPVELAYDVAVILDAQGGETLRPLVEPLYLAAASEGGALAARALTRAAALRLEQKDGNGALELLSRIPPNVDASQEGRQRKLEMEDEARRMSGEVALELYTDPPKELGPMSPDEAARVAARVYPSRLLHLGHQTMEVELENGDRKTIPLERIVAVAVGVAPDIDGDRPRKLLVTDVVLAWGAPNVGPLVIRLPSHALRLHELYPGIHPRDAYVKLLGQLLESSSATALPDRKRITRGEFPVYPDIASLEAAYYPRA